MSWRPDSKIAAHYRSSKDKLAAQASSNRFTAKQSQFSRKQEEKQVVQNLTGGSADISRFEQARRRVAAPSAVPAVAAFAGKKKESLFALHDGGDTSGLGWAQQQGPGRPYKRGRDEGGATIENISGGGLLGASHIAAPADTNDAAPNKKSRFEKFQEVIQNSRSARVRDQRERTDREKETENLDVEFDAVAHLLQKRDKRQEQIDAFAASGTPEVRELLKRFRESRSSGAKMVTLTSDGGLRVISEAPCPSASVASPATGAQSKPLLDADDKKLLAKLTSGKSVTLDPSPPTPGGANNSSRVDDDGDDFDKLLQTMRQGTQRATAVDRTLSPEEEQRLEARQLLLQAQRSAIPVVSADDPQLTRREWLEQGGDQAHQMDYDSNEDDGGDGDVLDLDYDAAASSSSEDDGDGKEVPAEGVNIETADTAAVSGMHPLDAELVKLEELCGGDSSSTDKAQRIPEVIDAIHLLCKKHSVHAAQSFRLLLIDMERRSIKGALPSPYDMVLLLAASRIFPVSDFRHPVATPLLIFLSSTLMQLPLSSPKHWKVAVVLSAILLGCMRAGSGKYCSELVLVPLNLLALQVPRRFLEPVQHRSVRMPCPVLVRPDDAVPPDQHLPATVRPVTILSSDVPSISQILMSAIGIFHGAALLYRANPAFDYAFRDPLHKVVALLDPAHIHPTIRQPLEELQQRIDALSNEAKAGRTPLAMRNFRPRPIRLFDPMLVEAQDPATKERKELKKELREDRKRVVRHVLAEASVERRAREKEAAAVDAHRERKYKQLMGELQAQEHVMKTVDNFMVKARSKKRKGVSGDPYKADSAAAAGGEADV
jgi:hypothetical protein